MFTYQTVSIVDSALDRSPFFRLGGSLLVMVGLPGTGKSLIVEHLIKILPAVVIRTDFVRRHIREVPTYTAAEMMLVYEVCYQIIELRLSQGQRVIFDGTNHAAARRQQLFEIAKKRGAPIAVCQVQASEEVIRQRLVTRKSGGRREGDMSDAGWSVYKWMVDAQEPIVHEHLVLDTTNNPPGVLARQLAAYWQAIEKKGNVQ